MDAVGRSGEEGGICVSDSGEWSGKDAGGGDLPKRERERWGIAGFKGSCSPSRARRVIARTVGRLNNSPRTHTEFKGDGRQTNGTNKVNQQLFSTDLFATKIANDINKKTQK
jgi:hypothetical protein